MSKPEEIRALAARVKDLRQELESVEARLREMSGDETPDPIEPLDSPTQLTTNHAMRRARAEQRTPWLAAGAAVAVLSAGIGLGYALHPPAESKAIVTSSVPPVAAPAPVPVPAPAPAPAPEPAPATAPEPAPAAVTVTTAATPAPLPPVPTVTPVSTLPRPSHPDRGF
jgi:hypothetical protein